MELFDFIMFVLAFSSSAMIVGGLYLLRRGVIALGRDTGAEGGNVFKAEIQGFKVTTKDRAIAFFATPLIALTVTGWLAQPNTVEPVTVTGRLRADDPSDVRVFVRSGQWLVEHQSDGLIQGTVLPHLNDLKVVVTAPAHSVPVAEKFLQAQSSWPFGSARSADVGTIDVGHLLKEKPAVDPAKIAPTQEPLPGQEQPGRF